MRFKQLFWIVACLSACQCHSKDPRPVAPVTAWSATPVSSEVRQVSNLLVIPASAPSPSTVVAAPWSLTASDGTGLVMTRLDAKAVVEGPLAFTELHLYFHNPESRTREGTFTITLPAGAAVSRFAMELDGQFMEAEVVEKQRARRVYEDYLHRGQDPALLEKGAGNQFSARVFPIAANAEKHLVLSYSQEITPGRYVMPLRGLATSKQLDVRVQVRGTGGELLEQTVSHRDWKPDHDIVVDGVANAVPIAITAGDLAAVRLPIAIANAAEAPRGITLLVDTSASRALGFDAEARRIQTLVEELGRVYGGALRVQVVAFDQEATVIYDGTASSASRIAAELIARGAFGASDLGGALASLHANPPQPRVVIVTDAVVTAGASDAALRSIAAGLSARVERIDVLLTGGIRDEQAAATITQALPRVGAVLDLDRGPADVARRLGLAVRTDVAIVADGARWVFPQRVAAAQSGDEVTVYLRRDPAKRDLAVRVADTTTKLEPIAVNPALLSRAVAGSEIIELEAQLAKATGDASTKLKAEIVKRSIASRIVSSQTSMLVLESEEEYQRFGIARTALAEILTVGPRGVELTGRTTIAKIATPDQRSAPVPSRDPADRDDDSGDEADRDIAPAPAPASPPPGDPDVMAKRDDADRANAQRQLSRLQRQQSEQNERIEAARAAASRAERRRGVTVSKECQENPLSRACDGPAEPSRPLSPREAREARAREARVRAQYERQEREEREARRRKPALEGPLADITTAIGRGKIDDALAKATAWRRSDPGNVLALIGLGEALEAKRNIPAAARAYGSIIDLYPNRADFRRFAGERLERLGGPYRTLMIDTYRRAVAERPDHMTGHRLLAYALLRNGQLAEAFAAILAGIDQPYPDGRFAGGMQVLREDAGMIGAAYVASSAAKRAEVTAALAKRSSQLATSPSTRFIMYWETDANDVDFHIDDARGAHASYERPALPSGGELYADITNGYGPECFAIPGTPKAAPYKLSINYYSQGPMGYGMGLLQIQKFDGKGGFSFVDRPYVVMVDEAFVDLGSHR